jgi:predicted nucleic acid-binding protein
MTFWDSSAIVPLLCEQRASAALLAFHAAAPGLHVWAWTPVECLSALRRLEREGSLGAGAARRARARLEDLRGAWAETGDLPAVRARAERCLMRHPLRAADAGQLAAALLLSERLARPIPFVTLDRRLGEAARQEGLEVVGDTLLPIAHERARKTHRRTTAQPSPYR